MHSDDSYTDNFAKIEGISPFPFLKGTLSGFAIGKQSIFEQNSTTQEVLMLLTEKNIVELSAMAIFSLWGGIVSHFVEREKNPSKRKSLISSLMNIFTSVFVGLLAGLFAIDSGYTTALMLCIAGVAGSMGSVLLNKLQQRIVEIFERK